MGLWNKTGVVVGLVVFFGVAQAQDAPMPAVDAKKVQVNDVDWPPYFLLKNQMLSPQHPGLAHELIEYCLPKTGLAENSWQFSEFPPKRTAKMSQDGEIDVIVYSKTKEREEYLVYGQVPLFEVVFSPYVAAKSEANYKSLDEMYGKTIATTAGLAYWPDFQEFLKTNVAKGGRIEESTHLISSMKKVSLGRADLGVEQADTIAWNALTAKMKDELRIIPVSFAAKPYFITVPKKSTRIADKEGFVKKFDECIMNYKKTPAYKEVLLNYGLK